MTASTVLLTIVLICLLCHSLKTCLNIVELVISFQVELGEDFTITGKAPTRAFSWLHLRHYAKQTGINPQYINMKLGCKRKDHLRIYANQPPFFWVVKSWL